MFENIETFPFWLQLIAISILFMFKTYAGTFLSVLLKFKYWQLILISICSSLSSISLSLKFKEFFLNLNLFSKNKKKGQFNGKLRRPIKFWRKYGFIGVMIISPVLIGIPTGAILADHFKTKKRKLFMFLTISSLIWMSIFYIVALFGKEIISQF